MAGRASVVLRDQFEVATRLSEVHDATAGVAEVRRRVVLALRIVRERLQPTERVGGQNDVAFRRTTPPEWKMERLQLLDEALELKRLLDHLELFLNA